MRKVANILRGLFVVIGIGYLFLYILVGNPIFGVRLCPLQAKIMTDEDLLKQLNEYVHKVSAEKSAVDINSYADPVIIDAALKAFGQCVQDKGFDDCEHVKLKHENTDIMFFYKDKMYGDGAAVFGMAATGKKAIRDFGASNFEELGCWFTGVED